MGVHIYITTTSTTLIVLEKARLAYFPMMTIERGFYVNEAAQKALAASNSVFTRRGGLCICNRYWPCMPGKWVELLIAVHVVQYHARYALGVRKMRAFAQSSRGRDMSPELLALVGAKFWTACSMSRLDAQI